MKTIGIIGLGDMGIGMAGNIIKAGYSLVGFDLRPERRQMLIDLGGTAAKSVGEVGGTCDLVFVMVLNGSQVQEVVLSEGGLCESMTPEKFIVVSATIKPSEILAIVPAVNSKGIHLVDSPVSGGKNGADTGTLTMMVAGSKSDFDAVLPVLNAVGQNINHVGNKVGQGQTVKGALQAIIGASFTAIFEAFVMGTKAGADPRKMLEVFSTSSAGSKLLQGCGELILQRKFENTGSHIGTMYKDLGISMSMARENGCAMFTTAAAYELFQTGIARYPEGDNWAIVKFLEEIAGIEVKG